jgi:hypothetical protein
VTVARPGRLRLAELTSGIGAVVLGVGLGVLAADRLGHVGLPLLLVGLGVHGRGMYDKHHLERRANAEDVWWEPVAYWTCWVLLGAIALGIIGRLLGLA